METLLMVVLIYVVVYGLDYLFYVKQPKSYKYESIRTYGVFIGAQLVLILSFYTSLEPFFAHIWTEVTALLVLLLFMLVFSTIFYSNRLLICHFASRSERCLTPTYVLVKGADIMVHQLSFLLIALAIKDMEITGVYAYGLFVAIVLLIHTPVVLSMSADIAKMLTIGLLLFSIPFFYTYTSLELLWPAVYVHALLYVFIWLVFADMEGTTLPKSG